MKNVKLFIFAVFVLILSGEVMCSPWSVSVSLGKIRTTQPDVSDLNKYAFVPELQIERGLFNITKDVNTISGAVYFSWWDDFVDEPTTRIMDACTYSHQFSTVGARLLLNSKVWKIHFSIYVGTSKNFIKSEYIGGSSYSGDIGEDYKDKKTFYQYGFNVDYPIVTKLSIGAGWIKEFTTTNDLLVNPRLGFKLRVTYDL